MGEVCAGECGFEWLEGGGWVEGRFGEGGDGFSPGFAEVAPVGVMGDDQGDLLNAAHVLESGFAGDGFEPGGEALVVDEAVDVIAGGEGVRVVFGLVLRDAGVELRGYSYVEATAFAGQDVDVACLVHGGSVYGG